MTERILALEPTKVPDFGSHVLTGGEQHMLLGLCQSQLGQLLQLLIKLALDEEYDEEGSTRIPSGSPTKKPTVVLI